MGDIKLFRMTGGKAHDLLGSAASLEKTLQSFIERNMEVLLGIRFLATEHSTGKTHGGRIDSLGLDENGCPVILEYKRSVNENVISQGLFYLDWLLDHRGEFELLVQRKLGKETSEGIEWSRPRLICIAGDFTKYDEHAVQQMGRNIELIRYRQFGDDLLLLELVNAVVGEEAPRAKAAANSSKRYTTAGELLEKADKGLQELYQDLKAHLLALGDDVQFGELKFYFAFKRIKNFACVEVHPQSSKLLVYLKIGPDRTQLEKGFSRDVRKVGHFGTGDLELTIRSRGDLEKAKPLLMKSYEQS